MVDGRFEPCETELVRDWLGRIDVFVDAGAHVGFFTCLAAAQGVRTVSIEPLIENLENLYVNLHINGLMGAEVFPLGLAETPGLRPLFGTSTGASLIPGWSSTSKQWSRTIAVNTLDNILRSRFEHKRLFVKMDIEGAEWGALSGASETLARTPAPAWLVEICLTENLPAGETNPHFGHVFELFWKHGYEGRTVDGQSRAVVGEDVARWLRTGKRDFGSYNFLFTRRSD